MGVKQYEVTFTRKEFEGMGLDDVYWDLPCLIFEVATALKASVWPLEGWDWRTMVPLFAVDFNAVTPPLSIRSAVKYRHCPYDTFQSHGTWKHDSEEPAFFKGAGELWHLMVTLRHLVSYSPSQREFMAELEEQMEEDTTVEEAALIFLEGIGCEIRILK